MKRKQLNPGDRIGWTKHFLKNTGHGPTDPAWRDLGTVVDAAPGGLDPTRFVCVRWDHEDRPGVAHSIVARCNVAKRGSLPYCEDITP